MWGIFPFGSSLLAIIVVLIPERRRHEKQAQLPFVNEQFVRESVAS
jgi:hypothetical protein